MRLVFAGTPPFAAAALAALADAGHEIVGVLTQPDRPAGRGMRMTTSAVKQLAQARALPVAQPPTLRDPNAQAALAALAPELMVVAAYGLLLPPAVLTIPRLGCLNIHASLLPRWRGAAPIQRAILAGDRSTGVCIMQMDAGLDTGPVWAARTLAIEPDDTAGSLLSRLTTLGAALIVEVLAGLDRLPQPVEQPMDGVSYAHKIDKLEAAIDFSVPALAIERQVRAFDPAPGAFCQFQGQLLKVWRVSVEPAPPPAGTPPGRLLCIDDARGLEVGCGGDRLWLHEVQRAGGRRQDALAFARAQGLAPGDQFEPGRSPAAATVAAVLAAGTTG